MFVIEPIKDVNLICSAITNSKVWPHVSDDFCDLSAYQPSFRSDILYLGVFSGDDYLGLFLVHEHNGACWEIHTALLPGAWGRSVDAGKSVLSWIFNNTPCRRVITNIPDGNYLARRLAKKCGFVEIGVNEKSILKGGVMRDQLILGVSRV